jgi:hypothetical protein
MTPDRPGQWGFVTLTAPGVAEGMVWSEDCGHLEGECSGELGCVVEPIVAAHWNGTAPRRWSDFVTYLRRILGCDVQFFGAWEPQKRGVLHRHAVMWVERPMSQRRMRAAVRLAARSWAFGTQLRVDVIDSEAAGRAAWYLAKYCTKTADGVDGVRLLDVRTGELKRCQGFRSWSSSRRWGDSMGRVRERQRAWVQSAGASGSVRRQPDAGAAGLDPKGGSSTACVAEGAPAMRVDAAGVVS